MLTAPGSKRLKQKHSQLLSSFAFKFNLRHYIMGQVQSAAARRLQWQQQRQWALEDGWTSTDQEVEAAAGEGEVGGAERAAAVAAATLRKCLDRGALSEPQTLALLGARAGLLAPTVELLRVATDLPWSSLTPAERSSPFDNPFTSFDNDAAEHHAPQDQAHGGGAAAAAASSFARRDARVVSFVTGEPPPRSNAAAGGGSSSRDGGNAGSGEGGVEYLQRGGGGGGELLLAQQAATALSQMIVSRVAVNAILSCPGDALGGLVALLHSSGRSDSARTARVAAAAAIGALSYGGRSACDRIVAEPGCVAGRACQMSPATSSSTSSTLVS